MNLLRGSYNNVGSHMRYEEMYSFSYIKNEVLKIWYVCVVSVVPLSKDLCFYHIFYTKYCNDFNARERNKFCQESTLLSPWLCRAPSPCCSLESLPV